MEKSRMTKASFAGVLKSVAVIVVVCMARVLPAQGDVVPFTEHVIVMAPYISGPHSVFTADLDGDGDIDVVSASQNDNKILWFESDGGFPPTFTLHIISNVAIQADQAIAADLDGDGDMDVPYVDQEEDKVAWFENLGGSPLTFSEWVITEDPDGPGPLQGFANETVCVYATDVDSDGDIDLLSASQYDDKIAWYENDGTPDPTFIPRVISTSADDAWEVYAIDVDGDGDTDVLSASRNDDKIAWYENDGGSPPTFIERVITEDPDGNGPLQGFADRPYRVFAADLDNDGDSDVLSASFNDNKIAWYENDGGSTPTFTARVISAVAMRATSVFAADVDGDGDTDVLSSSELDDKIAWYENDGSSPPGFTERVISTSADGGIGVFAADVDRDGDTDVLSCSLFDSKIAWYENTPPPIPTVSEWGLVVMSLLVLTAGTLVYARRRPGHA